MYLTQMFPCYFPMTPCNLPSDYFLRNLISHINSKLKVSFQTVFDIMNYTEGKQIPGLVMRIDIEKALPLVSLKFSFEFLKYSNFG